jgi:hypothetical protein
VQVFDLISHNKGRAVWVEKNLLGSPGCPSASPVTAYLTHDIRRVLRVAPSLFAIDLTRPL